MRSNTDSTSESKESTSDRKESTYVDVTFVEWPSVQVGMIAHLRIPFFNVSDGTNKKVNLAYANSWVVAHNSSEPSWPFLCAFRDMIWTFLWCASRVSMILKAEKKVNLVHANYGPAAPSSRKPSWPFFPPCEVLRNDREKGQLGTREVWTGNPQFA